MRRSCYWRFVLTLFAEPATACHETLLKQQQNAYGQPCVPMRMMPSRPRMRSSQNCCEKHATGAAPRLNNWRGGSSGGPQRKCRCNRQLTHWLFLIGTSLTPKLSGAGGTFRRIVASSPASA